MGSQLVKLDYPCTVKDRRGRSLNRIRKVAIRFAYRTEEEAPNSPPRPRGGRKQRGAAGTKRI